MIYPLSWSLTIVIQYPFFVTSYNSVQKMDYFRYGKEALNRFHISFPFAFRSINVEPIYSIFSPCQCSLNDRKILKWIREVVQKALKL